VLQTFLPGSKTLQKYIAFFYTWDAAAPATISYWAFPHLNTGMSFFKGASVSRKDFQVKIEEVPVANIHIEVLGKYKTPVLVNYSGQIKEVAIIFHPLGINRFIKDSYHYIAPHFSQPFQNPEWVQFGNTLFDSENAIQELEAFLLSRLIDTPEISKIEKSLKFIEDCDVNYPVSEIARRVGYTEKSFQRHFTRHMGCSPVDYKRIVRFRNALTSKLNANELKSLTHISYENNYFDQSYFIKEFRKLTNHSPKQFFKEIKQVDGDKLIWEII